MTNHHFSWEEEARQVLEKLYDWGCNDALVEFENKEKRANEALQSLNQAFKQAVDSAKPENKTLKTGYLWDSADAIDGYHHGTGLYQANLIKLIDGEKQ